MTQAVINAQANELQRIEDAAVAVTTAMFPTRSTDVPLLNGSWTAPILSMWETLLNLPVNPSGVSLADRRSKVQAHIQKRNSGAGSDWVAVLTEGLGPVAWTHQEGPGPYQVTILIPYVAGSYSAGQVAALARAITPAHLDLSVGYAEGFLVGISLVGLEPL